MTPSTARSEPTLSGNPFEVAPPSWALVEEERSGLGADGVLRINTPRVFLPLLAKGPKYKGAYGGRGSAKSHFFAEYLVEECVSDPNTRAMCVREFQTSLKESSKKLVEDKIEELGVSAYFEVLHDVIHVLDDDGRRRGIIVFIGLANHTAKSIKSYEGFRIAWVEEGQTISQSSWDLLYPTIRANGGEVWVSWNPEKASDPVDVFFRHEDAANDNDIVSVEVNYVDNPWFWSTSLANDMRRDRRRDKDRYRHIWLGQYLTRSRASVFTNWQVLRFETPASVERFYFGADWGFSVDPTVLIRCWIGRLSGSEEEGWTAVYDPNGKHLFFDREAWKVGCEIDETPALFAGDCPPKLLGPNGGPKWTNGPDDYHPNRATHSGVEGALDWPITADSARPETISYMRRASFKIHPALKGPGSVEDGIEFLKDFDLVIHEDECPNVAREVGAYSYKVDPKTDEVLPILEDKDNHTIDSARYATENIRRARRMRIRGSAVEATKAGRPSIERRYVAPGSGPSVPAVARRALGITDAALKKTS